MSDNEKQLFESLALKHMDGLYSRAIRLAKNVDGAEKLVQYTYAGAFNSFEQFDKNSDFGKWVKGILMRIYYASLSTKYPENYDTMHG